MIEFVRKRDGSVEPFTQDKIATAIQKAMKAVDMIDDEIVSKATKKALGKIKKEDENTARVDHIHEIVENSLMDMKLYEVAREYITYRDNNKPDILRPRINYKPFEYPQLASYVEAIQNSYWVHTEYNYSSDVQDFRTNMTEPEKECIRRCMLGISQIEVKVKDFWGKVGDKFPKPEIAEVGAVFAESEVRHARSYSHLLEIAGLNNQFQDLLEIPVFKKRLQYISKAMMGTKSDNIEDYIETLIYFSLFIENVSLFSQFLIISTFNKEKSYVKGMANAVGATSLEERIHAMFGSELINVLREERPDVFSIDLENRIMNMVNESFEAERDLVDWTFEAGDFDFLRKSDVIEYIKKRYNDGLVDCGFKPPFSVDQHAYNRVSWFDIQNNASSMTDFFVKRPVEYSKGKDFNDIF